MALWLKLWPILKNKMEKGAFSLFRIAAYLSPWQPNKISILETNRRRKNYFLLLFFSFSFFFSFSTHTGFASVIMQAAVDGGDAKKLAELIRQDPGFKVNQQDEDGLTLLHYACGEDHRSAVIPLLLAHPDIDVNVKDTSGQTPFYWACLWIHLLCS